MNKLNYFLIGAAGLLLASCAQDDFLGPNVSGEYANVTFNLTSPQFQTRYGDGKSANKLQYAVYDTTNGQEFLFEKIYEQDFVTSANITIQLANEHSYKVVFWAATKEENPYTVTFNEEGAKLTVDYSEGKVTANNDNLDAFYGCVPIENVKGDVQLNVGLTRPLAQLNIGTNDYTYAKEKLNITLPTESSITVGRVANELDLLTGETKGEEEVTYATASIDNENNQFPKDGYEYLAMAYVLMGNDNENHNVIFRYDEGSAVKERTVNEVPMQRNHRTNIYGAILTSTYGLVIDKEEWGGANDAALKWDGNSSTTPAITETNVLVSRASDLAGLAEIINSGDLSKLEDKDIILVNDLDMGGNPFPMIGATSRNGASPENKDNIFKGVFDGNGKTISNLTVKYEGGDKTAIVGFIAALDGEDSELKNLTFENLQIDGGASEQAGVVGTLTGGAKVTNVKVMGGKVSSKEAAGGIVGRLMKDGIIENCENHATINSPQNTGGIVGAAYYLEAGKTMKIDGCNNYGEINGTVGVGGIAGLSCAEVTNCTNNGKTVTGTGASVGGIVGEQKGTGKIENCNNYADVTGSTSASIYGAGGIVGWVRYTNDPNYMGLQSPITVSGCVNYAKHISGPTGVGGIVGTWYSDGVCEGNTNYAETITAVGSFAAGIVGNSQWTEYDSTGTTPASQDLRLEVKNNTSYTTSDAIKASGSKHDIVYINDNRTTEENNKKPNVSNVSNDSDLQSALNNAQDGDLIRLTPGTYSNFTYVANNKYQTENVIIDANGAVFEGINNLNFNETTIVRNATFRNYTTPKDSYGACGAWGEICGTFENCVFEGESGLRFATCNGNVIFRKCKFIATNEHAAHINSGKASLVKFEDCYLSGYCPLGNSIEKYELSNCVFESNDKGFGGVGLRRNCVLTNCEFNISCGKDHDDIAVKSKSFTYEFNQCKVNGTDLSSSNLTVDEDDTTVKINGSSETLSKRIPY